MTPATTDERPAESRPGIPWAVIVAGWAILSTIVATQAYVEKFISGALGSFLAHLVWLAVSWAFWVPVAPLVLALGRRWPLRRQRWWRASVIHLLFSLLFGLAHAMYFAAVSLRLSPLPEIETITWIQAVVIMIAWSLHAEVFIYWSVLGAGQALAHYQHARERERRAAQLQVQLGQARIAALESRLRPHFLFNSLNTVSMLVRQGENERAVGMIAELGELLRATLRGNDAQEIALGTELDFVRRYLEIESLRFADRLRLEIDVDDELADVPVPNLILQPLVENAVRHGLSASEDAGLVAIRAVRDNGFLEMSVCDDGPGPPPGFDLEADTGVGLENTRERLRELYGDAQELRLERRGGVTEARVRIPCAV